MDRIDPSGSTKKFGARIDGPAPDMDSLLADLDPEQREAVTNIRGPSCILAGAGTGKTRVITHRIAYAISAGVTDQSKTLALTFTARAAGEMRSRLRTLGVPNAAARTFHSAALKQLIYFWPYSLGGPFPKLITSKAGILAEAIENADTPLAPGAQTLREISGEIEWAKALQTAPADYIESALGSGRSLRIPNGRPDKDNFFEIAKVYQAYETLKYQERLIDFEDVLLLTVGMLEEDRGVRERIRDQYRYFTVDEYQDVSPLQQRLLNLWLGDRQDICVVGDPAQTIYSFAGATADFLLGFTGRFPTAHVTRLTRGYRSTPEIIDIANQVLKAGSTNSDHQLTSMNARGEKLDIRSFSTTSAEVAGVVDELIAVLGQASKRGANAGAVNHVAILARTNSQLDPFEAALKSRGIEMQLKSTERFFDRVDVRDAMRIIRSASVIPGEEGDWIADLRSALRLFGTTDYVRAFVTLAEEMKANGADNLRTFLRELEDRAEQNNPPTLPGVVLSTLHAAKGLEWDHVFLVGINDGILPLGEAIEEERRLFYVGLTRARRTIHLSYSGQASQFLESLRI
jgi:DNA helicase II / ATP-dependent DNA helicase PcrA